MAIGLENFQPETFEQANPFLTGYNAAQQIQQTGIQNQYLGPTLAAQLRSQQLQNMEQTPIAAQAPQFAAAQLAYQKQQGPLAEAQAQAARAQAGLTGAQTQYFPITAQGQYLRGAGEYLRGNYLNGGLHALSLLHGDPTFQALAANNPDLANSIQTIMTNSVMGGGLGAGLPNFPSIGGASSGIPANALGNVQAAQNGNSFNAPTGSQNLSQLPLSQNQINTLKNLYGNGSNNQANTSTVQDIYGSKSIDQTIPKSIQMQRYYSQSFDKQFEPWLQKLPDIANFAGAAGKANLAIDKYAASANIGPTNPQYQQWNSFVNAASHLAGNELRRSLGVNSSIQAQKDAEDLQTPGFWDEHPVDALSRFNALLAAKKANDQVISASPNQTLQQLQTSNAKPAFQFATTPGQGVSLGSGKYQVALPNGKNRVITDEDIEETIKASGGKITRQQLLQKLGDSIMATNLLQDPDFSGMLGSNPEATAKPVGNNLANDPDFASQLSQASQQLPFPGNAISSVFNKGLGGNAAAGLLTGALDVANLPHILAQRFGYSIPSVLPGQTGASILNVQPKSPLESLAQSAGSYVAPSLAGIAATAAIPEELGAAGIAGLSPLARALTSTAGKAGVSGAITGASQNPQSPLMSAFVGGVLNAAVGPVIGLAKQAVPNLLSKFSAPMLGNSIGNMLENSRNVTNQQALEKINQNFSTYSTNEKNAWENAKTQAANADQAGNYNNSDYVDSIDQRKQQIAEQVKNQPVTSSSNQGAQTVLDQIGNSQHSTFQDAIAHNQALNQAYGENLSPTTGVPKTDSEFNTINYAIGNIKSNLQNNIKENGLEGTLGKSLEDANTATQQKNQIFNEVTTPGGGSKRSLYNQQQSNQNPLSDPNSIIKQYIPGPKEQGIGKFQQFEQMVGDPDLAKATLKRNIFQNSYTGSNATGGENFDPSSFMKTYSKLSDDQRNYLFNDDEQKTIGALQNLLAKSPKALKGNISTGHGLAATLGIVGSALGEHAGGAPGMIAGASLAATPYLLHSITSNPTISNSIVNYLTKTTSNGVLPSTLSRLGQLTPSLARSLVTPWASTTFGGNQQ